MLITKRSLLTGKINAMDIPVTQKQLEDWVGSSRVIQEALPQLTADQREFLLSGATPEEWDSAWEEDES